MGIEHSQGAGDRVRKKEAEAHAVVELAGDPTRVYKHVNRSMINL